MESPAVLPPSAPVPAPSGWWAICLCADWCGTCRDYRNLFEALAPAHPGVRFVWLMGADNLVSIHRWNAWTEIYGKVPIAVLDRPGWRLRGLSSKAAERYRQEFVGEERAISLPSRRPPAWTLRCASSFLTPRSALRATSAIGRLARSNS